MESLLKERNLTSTQITNSSPTIYLTRSLISLSSSSPLSYSHHLSYSFPHFTFFFFSFILLLLYPVTSFYLSSTFFIYFFLPSLYNSSISPSLSLSCSLLPVSLTPFFLHFYLFHFFLSLISHF